jgi:hypothetical protein
VYAVVSKQAQVKSRRVTKSTKATSKVEAKLDSSVSQDVNHPLTGASPQNVAQLFVIKIYSTDEELLFFQREVNAIVKL